MKATLIHNALIVNEGALFKGSILVEDGKIVHIYKVVPDEILGRSVIIDAQGKVLMPGVIDDQVHFREPGLTQKGDIFTESRAAVAGGVTSFMEMPNTQPQTLTQSLLEEKYKLGSEKSLANFSFYMGASNDNLDELSKTNPKNVCGIKVFMGASTGNMLVDNQETLKHIFAEAPTLVAVHCEDENTIKQNIEKYRNEYGEEVPVKFHPYIRSEEACYKSSSMAIELAAKYNTRLHILHLSTAKELSLFRNDIPLTEKRVTAEVCVHHLWFDESSYAEKGNFIKWNPAIKKTEDKKALFHALLSNKIDVIATDHAPHTLEEKKNTYFKAPSGGPLIQHSLVAMLEFYQEGKISLERIVEKMCHAPADLFRVSKRGYIREGYQADLVLIDLNSPWTVNKSNILYKCGWSPFEGTTFHSKVSHTFVNGELVYENGKIDETIRGQRLLFER
jgi:dihydroorotase